MTERTEELVCYGPDGAPQALAEAQEIAESIGGATPSGRDAGNRVAALASVATRVAGKHPLLAERLTVEAEAVAQQEVPKETRSAALCEVIEAVAATDPEHAAHIAGRLPAVDFGEVRQAGLILAVAWAGTDPDRAEFLVRAQEQPAHKAVALAQLAAAMQPANPARAAGLADEAGRLAATVCARWGAGSILTALTYQRMAAAFAASDPPRALGYAHAVAPTPETALVRVDTLVDIATAVPAPRPRRSPRLPRQRQG